MDVETSTMSNMRGLTSAISTVDLEIEWFKKTDCVYSHKIQNSLPLKNESGVGVYLCQVTCEDRIKNINISLKEAPGTEQTSTCKLNDKQWTDNERINKTCSALLAVFSTLQKVLQIDGQGDEAAKHLDKQQQGCPEYKDYDRKDNNASVQQTRKKVKQKEIKPEEKDPRQENKRQESTKQSESTAMETSPFQPFDKGNLFNKELDCAEKSKGTKTDRQGDDDQNEAGENLDNQQPGSPENKDYDKKDNNASVQQTRKKVEHKETNPEEKDTRQEYTSTEESWTIIPMDTSPSQPVNEDSLGNHQLDCADKKKSNSLDRSSKEEESLIKKMKTDEVAVFTIEAGKTNDCHKKFILNLQSRIENMREVRSVDESEVVLIFCPIVSRAGTDVDAALAKISYQYAFKLTVLVVLHHTFDPEKTVSDSSKSVNKENLLTVDCLFYEDTGLLDCQRNSDAYDKSVNWLIAQGHKIGVTIAQSKPYSLWPSKCSISISNLFSKWNKQDTSGDSSTLSCQVKYFLSVTGDAQKHHVHFLNHLQQKMNLKKVSAVKDSDVILLFCPEINDYHKRTDKPVVLISLYKTKDQESVKKINKLENRGPLHPVDYVFLEGKELLDCQLNNYGIKMVFDLLNKKPEGQNTEETSMNI